MPDGRVQRFSYDPNGNLVSIEPSGRKKHLFSYDKTDKTTAYSPPAIQNIPMASTDQTYDLDHAPIKTTLADGREIIFGYDTSGRRDKVATPSGDYRTLYSPTTGLIDRVEGFVGTQSPPNSASYFDFNYDGDLLTGMSFTQEEVTGTINWFYDDALRVSSYKVNNDTISLAYNDDSFVTQVGELSFMYGPISGAPISTQIHNLASSRTINGFGEVENDNYFYNASPLFSAQNTYDDFGQIIDRSEIIDGRTQDFSYSYDTSSRLKEVFKNGTLVDTFAYDSNGNIINRDQNGTLINATFDDQDRLISRGTKNHRYNDHGQLLEIADISGDITNLDYDVFGNLREVVLPNGDTVDYIIDAFGQRVGKRFNGTFEEGWIYAGGLRPVASVNAAGLVTAQYVYGMRSNVPEFMIKGNQTLRFIVDHQGSVRLVVDTQTGAILQAIDYDVFGKKIRDTNPGFQPFGFAGGLHDKHTGFVQFSARDYDPESGRWTAKDPAGFGGGDFNLYTYASNDPVNYVDPTGLFAEICRDGNVVKIKLSIRYRGYKVNDITEGWDRAIEKAWSGKFGKYTVYTRVENPFFPGLAVGSKWNTVYVEDGGLETSYTVKHTTGHWRKNQIGNVAAHEAGHFMHVVDRYYPKDDPDPKRAGRTIPGYEGTLMAESKKGGVNNEATITELLNNNDVKKCKSGGGCN